MAKQLHSQSCLSPIALAVCALLSVHKGQAQEYFDPSLLTANEGMSEQVDLSVFANQGGALPGTYLVDIYINNEYVDSRNVSFIQDKQSHQLYPQLTPKQLAAMGVNLASVKSLQHVPDNEPFGELDKFIPSASTRLDMTQLRLDISVPQVSMQSQAIGIANPKLWDEGINAFLLNYSITGQNSWQNSQSNGWQRQDSLFSNLNGGLNVGAWRLRSGGSYSLNHGSGDGQTISQWTRNDVYLQRDLPWLHSELTLGEINTGGDIFDSVALRGAKLETNDDMTPDNERGFAPVITGIANSNAQITIRQNGNILYQTYVAPGPFRITDLIGGNNQGDLQVTIKEADGTQRQFTQAYSSLPIMQKEGHLEYQLAMGKYRNAGSTDGSRAPYFGQGTAMYGLPHDFTVYGGAILANDYQSLALGTGVSLGEWGAFSTDATLSIAQLPGQNDRQIGGAFRAKYSKSMLSSGTTMDLTAYRYATSNYYSFADVNGLGYQLNDDTAPWAMDRRRSSWQMTLSQTMGDFGSLSFNGTRDDYWGANKTNYQLSAGYNVSIKQLGIGFNYSIDHVKGDGSWPENKTFSVNLTLPLSLFTSNAGQMPTVSYNYMTNNRGNATNNLSVGGAFTDRLGYSVSQNWGNQGQGSGGSAGLNYQSDIGSSNVNYNYSRGQRNINYGFNGGLLVSGQGAALAPNLGDGAILIRAPGAAGVNVLSGNTSTNAWGYAVTSGGSAYRRNTVSIDPSNLPDGVSINQTSVNVYPTKGAVVVANYKAKVGQQLLMNLKYQGKPVPFGATASLLGDDDQNDAGIVGDGGQVYLTGMPQQGQLKVQWGQEAYQQCVVHFTLNKPALTGKTGDFVAMTQVDGQCQ